LANNPLIQHVHRQIKGGDFATSLESVRTNRDYSSQSSTDLIQLVQNAIKGGDFIGRHWQVEWSTQSQNKSGLLFTISLLVYSYTHNHCASKVLQGITTDHLLLYQRGAKVLGFLGARGGEAHSSQFLC